MHSTKPVGDDLAAWLNRVGLGKYAAVLAENDLSLDLLSDLTDQDLRELGFSLGHRKLLRRALADRSQTVEAGAAERRQLTVMFCDLVGSTALSVELDPEDLRELINRFRDHCVRVIKRFDGHVARFMGDGILVYFGYPRANENDPESAVRAGLDICAAIGAMRAGDHLKLAVRVGIATGEVVVGDLLDDDYANEQAVVGQTPNLAARLQALAKPGCVVVSPETRARVAGLFDFIDLGEQALKGFVSQITAWQVLRERNVESRFYATRSALDLAPLVGRDPELATLTERWRRVVSGQGQVVIISGEAGLGKSRLTHALVEHLAQQNYLLLRYYGVTYFQHTALYPVIKQIERGAGLRPEDTPDLKLDKLEAMLDRSFRERRIEVMPLFAGLLSIPFEPRYAHHNLSAELVRKKTLDALEDNLIGLAAEQPVVAIFEDLHWVDPVTVEHISRSVSRITSAPVLLLLTHRPDFVDSIDGADHITRIPLEKLDTAAGVEIIRHLTAGNQLPAAWGEQILTRTDGVPLFIEELTRTLLESGAFDQAEAGKQAVPVILPNTLQDSLMARLDRLGPAKAIAQVGSVIGRQFSRDLLGAVAQLDGDSLAEQLERLAAADLLRASEISGDEVYSFKHALIQDAAYASLLRERRRKLHARVARVLEQRFPALTESEPERLARHHTEAGQGRAAIPFLLKAASSAASRAAHAQSISHLTAALALTRELPEGEDRDRLELETQLPLAVNLAASRGYAAPEVVSAYDRAQELCERVGDAVDSFPILSGLVSYYLVRGEHLTSQRIAEQGLQVAADSKRPDYQIDAERIHGYTQFFLGRFDSARASLERCVEIYRQHQQRPLMFASVEHPAAAALALLPWALWFLGRTADALAREAEGRALVESLGHPFNVAFVYTWYAGFRQLNGESAVAVEHARKAVELSSSHGFQWLAPAALHLAICQTALGEGTSGLELFEKTMPEFKGAGANAFISYYVGGLGTIHAALGNREQARAAIETALEHSDTHSELFYLAGLHLHRGELVSSDAPLLAQADFERAVAIAREQGARAIELRAELALQRLLCQQGRGKPSMDRLRALSAGCDPRADQLILGEVNRFLDRMHAS